MTEHTPPVEPKAKRLKRRLEPSVAFVLVIATVTVGLVAISQTGAWLILGLLRDAPGPQPTGDTLGIAAISMLSGLVAGLLGGQAIGKRAQEEEPER